MKKRLFAVILSILSVLSAVLLTGCEKITAYALVAGAMAKTSALDSIDGEMTMNMNMSTMGVTMEVPVTTTIKAAGLQGENPVMSMDMTMSILETEVTANIYAENEYFYITMLGQSMKMKAGELTEEYDVLSDLKDTMQLPPEDLLKDVEIVTNEDGTRTVSLDIPDETFAEIYKDLLESTEESAASGSAVSDVTVANAKTEITVDANGYIAVYKLEFDMSMKVEGETIAIQTDATVKYNAPGNAVTVTPPEGYQDFTEITEDDLNGGSEV